MELCFSHHPHVSSLPVPDVAGGKLVEPWGPFVLVRHAGIRDRPAKGRTIESSTVPQAADKMGRLTVRLLKTRPWPRKSNTNNKTVTAVRPIRVIIMGKSRVSNGQTLRASAQRESLHASLLPFAAQRKLSTARHACCF